MHWVKMEVIMLVMWVVVISSTSMCALEKNLDMVEHSALLSTTAIYVQHIHIGSQLESNPLKKIKTVQHF